MPTSKQPTKRTKNQAPQPVPSPKVRVKVGEPHGTAELSTWLYFREGSADVVRIQTRKPKHTKAILELGKRKRDPDAKPCRVAYDCLGGYLRVYQLKMPALAAIKFVNRQLKAKPA